MKIDQSTLAMQSTGSRSQTLDVRESLRVWLDRPAVAAAPAQPSVSVDISTAARQQQSGESAKVDGSSEGTDSNPQMQLVKTLVEQMTGVRIRIFDARQLQTAKADSAAPAPRASFGAELSRQVSYSETQTATFQASGTIKTSDGKEIQFDLKLAMQYQYSETSQTTLRIGNAPRKTDPLVINFNGTAAQLSDQTFAFDLNSDGKQETLSQLKPGSGFLALDSNGDGKITSGKELFGPASGNGFSDLAKYDSDKNGWIDENDPIFSQLKVWQKDAAGKDSLSSLKSLGIGAISLHAVDTPFDIKNNANQTQGSVRGSSVYLNENGSAGSVQQLDLVAY